MSAWEREQSLGWHHSITPVGNPPSPESGNKRTLIPRHLQRVPFLVCDILGTKLKQMAVQEHHLMVRIVAGTTTSVLDNAVAGGFTQCQYGKFITGDAFIGY